MPKFEDVTTDERFGKVRLQEMKMKAHDGGSTVHDTTYQ